MAVRRTAAAIAFSLVFHAAALAVAGFFLNEAPGAPSPSVLKVGLAAPGKDPSEEAGASALEAHGDEISESRIDSFPAVDESAGPLPAAAGGSSEAVPPSAVMETKNGIAGVSRPSGIPESGVAEPGADPGWSSGSRQSARKPEPLEAISPEYPLMARRMGLDGTVTLDIRVTEEGRPSGCRIVEPRTHRILEEAALAAAMNARYRPGTKNDVPVEDVVRLKVIFRLDA